MSSENRGGRRDYQPGRPKKSLAQARIDGFLKESGRYKRKHGKSVEELLLDVIHAVGWAVDATMTSRLNAMRIYFQQTMPSVSESNVTVSRAEGPGVLLPPEMPDKLAEEAAVH